MCSASSKHEPWRVRTWHGDPPPPHPVVVAVGVQDVVAGQVHRAAAGSRTGTCAGCRVSTDQPVAVAGAGHRRARAEHRRRRARGGPARSPARGPGSRPRSCSRWAGSTRSSRCAAGPAATQPSGGARRGAPPATHGRAAGRARGGCPRPTRSRTSPRAAAPARGGRESCPPPRRRCAGTSPGVAPHQREATRDRTGACCPSSGTRPCVEWRGRGRRAAATGRGVRVHLGTAAQLAARPHRGDVAAARSRPAAACRPTRRSRRRRRRCTAGPRPSRSLISATR